MKQPRKHAELIKAWADGAEIQYFKRVENEWIDAATPSWSDEFNYRIKPDPKPDVVRWVYGRKGMGYDSFREACDEVNDVKPNLKLTFDGETGQLKSAEVL